MDRKMGMKSKNLQWSRNLAREAGRERESMDTPVAEVVRRSGAGVGKTEAKAG